MHRGAAAGMALLAALLLAADARAGVGRPCEPPPPASAAQLDRQLRLAERVQAELARSGLPLAIVARSGMDLSRIGHRYSHAGVALRGSAYAPWSVRQLYYDCGARGPRIVDEGLPGFVLGIDDADHNRISVLLMPGEAAQALAQAALDDRRALALLAPRYSANAHAFGLSYQNCNQWLAELLADAWAPGGAPTRAEAQDWLRANGYQPARIDLTWQPWLWLALASPWLRVDDHPPADVEAGVLHVSMPASIDAFVKARWPSMRRIEFCQATSRLVLRRDGPSMDEACTPGPGDEVTELD